ncbi:hypothetical protein [Nocardioides sp.]|uniref:hypothetical protein n=1 Tax=Nocardioides sp. TaxID=35761 RepID=UPI002732C3F2|nr:hypothetical protein [Nocardioides sp.]MDP3892566.1 hypothetical protein [Nocardioides sp.]
MSALRTSYDFTLPRGYVDDRGEVHRKGRMRLATARDELEPLRDPTVSGPDDPRLTILVLTRVVEALGSLELITTRDIEGLFAVDLAFLQDFYGVINFGNQEEYDALVQAQESSTLLGSERPAAAPEPEPATEPGSGSDERDERRPSQRGAVEEIPRKAQ